jgi:hypothetical protein
VSEDVTAVEEVDTLEEPEGSGEPDALAEAENILDLLGGGGTRPEYDYDEETAVLETPPLEADVVSTTPIPGRVDAKID